MNWQPQFEIEQMLAEGSVGSIEDWRRIKDYLAGFFAMYLSQEVETVWGQYHEDISQGGSFSFGIRSRASLGGPLGLEWYGVISHGHGQTEALVLLFAQDQRAVNCEGSEYLYFEYSPTSEGFRAWESLGWSSSEMHEWEGYTRLSEVCQEMQQYRERPENPS